MRTINTLISVLILILILNCSPDSKNEIIENRYLIQNVNVLSMTSDSILMEHDVYIEGSFIKSIGQNIAATLDDKIIKIDGNGKYLVPGLIDAYTHIHEKSLVPEIANGVTTVVNAIGSPFQHGLKFLVEKDSIIGPRIVSFSTPISGNPLFYHTQSALSGSEQTLNALDEIEHAGYDGIFTYINVDSLVYKVAHEKAESNGLLRKGHVPFKISKEFFTKSEQESFDNLIGLINPRNGETYDEQWLSDLAQSFKNNNKYVVPTLTIHKIKAAKNVDNLLFNDTYVLPRQLAYWHLDENTNYSYHGAMEIVTNFYKEGVKLLIGTDGGYHFVPHGFSYHQEMKNFSELGITNYDILKAATIDASDYLGLSNEIGTIEDGKVADLVLLDANPLENIENINKINGVMLRGKWLDKEKITQLLLNLKNEIAQLPSRDRLQSFEDLDESYSLYGEYSILFKNQQCGVERIFIKQMENKLEWLSQNIIDPHAERHTITKWITDNKNTVEKLSLKRLSSAGEEKVTLTVKNDDIIIDAILPFKKDMTFTKEYSLGELVGGPNTSVNLDMDIIINFIMLFKQIEDLEINQEKKMFMNKIELNAEEWGEASIFGKTEYSFKRVTNTKSPNITYEMKELGFNSSEDFPFHGLLEYNNEGNLESLIFNDNIQVKRKK